MRTVAVEVKGKGPDGKDTVLENIDVEQCDSLAEATQKFGEVGIVKLVNSAYRNQQRNKAALKHKPVSPKASLSRVMDKLSKGEITQHEAQAQVNAILASAGKKAA